MFKFFGKGFIKILTCFLILFLLATAVLSSRYMISHHDDNSDSSQKERRKPSSFQNPPDGYRFKNEMRKSGIKQP
ncbi:MAG: hypothetical protein LBI55_00275 [Oscillospiraceae bacterium]|nr:hypothetical protein [Oscillospiraceae bacterium]